MPEDPKPADAGQGGSDGGGGDPKPATPDVVERSEFRKVVEERDAAKAAAAAAGGTLESLRAEFGGDLSVDDIKELKVLREERANAERKKLEDQGEFEKLLAAQKKEHEEARAALAKRNDVLEVSLKRELVGRQVTQKLIAKGVDPAAVARAEEALLAGDGGISIGMKQLDNNRHDLTLANAAGAWPVDSETGAELTLDGHIEGFKKRNPFFFKPTVASGAGGGPSDGTPGGGGPQSGGTDADLNKALDGDDQEAYQKHREQLFGVKPAGSAAS